MATLTGTLAFSKAYDNAAYAQPDPLAFAATPAAANSLGQKFVSFTGRQIKSLTLLPTTAPEAADVLKAVLVTSLPVNFVGAGGGTASFASGTSTITITNLGTVGSGVVAPQYFNISQGTYTVTVLNGTTTSTATNYVFPSGVAGGLSVAAGDSFWFQKGTSTASIYVGEFETFFTPGTSFTL